MLKNKKGFTLIELLVAIAIMISITVIAIISITKISEQNKKQAYELVKEQVKTAALEYFSANEYLFEGLKNGSVAKITVEKMVESGYINSVVNPITGNKLNGCDYVLVTKTNNGYSYEFDTDTKNNCDYDNSIIVRANISESDEPSDVELSPEISPVLSCKDNNGSVSPYTNNNWCNNSISIKLTAPNGSDLPIGLDISDLTVGNTTGHNYSIDGNYILNDSYNSSSSTGTTFSVKVKGTLVTSSWKIDNTQPQLELIQKKYGNTDYVHIDLDNYTTIDEVNDATYKLSKDTTNKTWINSGTISTLSDYDGQWTSGQVVMIPAVENVGPSGVKFDCTDLIKGSKFGSANFKQDGTEKENDIYVRDSIEKNFSCVAVTGAGLKSNTENAIIKVDNTQPQLELVQKQYGNTEYVHIDLDNYTTIDEVNDATYKLSKNTTNKTWINSGKISTLSDYDGEWTSGQVVMIPAVKKVGPSGVKFDCIDNGNKSYKFGTYNEAENEIYVRTTMEKSFTCVAISGTGLRSNEKTVTIKIDKTVPTVDLIMKKKDGSSNLNSSSNITSLSNYTNGEIYNGYVFTKTDVKNIGPSGADVSCTRTKRNYLTDSSNKTLDFNETGQNINEEGVTTIRCTATSGSGITSTQITKTIKLERNLKMVLNEEKMKSVASVNNSNNKVFNTKYSGIKYYSKSDYMGCNEYSSSNTNGCKLGGSLNNGYFGYIGTACKNVGGYRREFSVDSPVDWAINTWLYDDEQSADDTLYGTIYDSKNANYLRTCNNLNSSFNTNCGNKTSGTPNFTTHKYYYQSYSGATSNEVILYTKYTVDCKYQ